MSHPLSLPLVCRALVGAALDPPQSTADVAGFAAVSLILREQQEGLHLLLIERTVCVSDPWSGHVALPGGRSDPTDPSLLYTAQREVREEVGIDLTAYATCLGTLPDVPAVARGRRMDLTIRPFVFHLRQEVPLRLDRREVAAAVWVSLDWLASGRADTQYRYAPAAQPGDAPVAHQLPAYQIEGRIVWGLTYLMLRGLLRRVMEQHSS